MRALQIVKPRRFRIVEIPLPKPAADEILVRMDYAAMCNQNDYKIFYGLYGDLIQYPCDPGVYGHEGVGTVVQLGAKVKGLAKGDRVVMMGEGGPMLYMEYVTRKADTVARISRAVPLKEAAVLELFGCAHHCMEIVGKVRGKKVAVSGLGPAGLAILQMLRLRTPREIVGIEISPARARVAKSLGLAKVLNPAARQGMARLIAENIDTVIDTTGCPAGMLNAFEIARKEVVIFGFTNEAFEVDQSKWFQKELVIRNSKVQTIDNLRAVCRLLERGRIRTRGLISAVMPFEKYAEAVRKLYEKKAAIHGTCVKFFTDNQEFMDMWEENFEPMPDWIRPHARLFAISDRSRKLCVEYEPLSKTVIIRNCDYYGWVKSIALALVADFLEDVPSEHKRYSVHGSFVDCGGRGVAIIGPPKSGKTTLTYGLLLDEKNNFLTDDWFFVRLAGSDTLAFSAEENSYIGADLAQNWPQLARKLRGLKCDSRNRAIVDVKRFFGEDRIRKESNLKLVVLLTREKGKPSLKKLTAADATRFMQRHDFCNPHQLVRSGAKMKARKEFFAELFGRAPVYLLNTIETPEKSLERLKRLIAQSD